MRVYEYVLEFMLKGFTNMGRTQVVDYLLNYPMLREGDISESEGARLDSITEPYQLVKVGVKAPGYTGVTIDGHEYDLYTSKADWIIVVDDNASTLKMAGHILSRAGMRVTALKSGRVALDYIQKK